VVTSRTVSGRFVAQIPTSAVHHGFTQLLSASVNTVRSVPIPGTTASFLVLTFVRLTLKLNDFRFS
jgi:hypothetical protein